MFHDIPATMRGVMRELEEQNERDQRAVRSVSEDVGRCLALLAVSAPQGAFLELGSSCGYSSLWLSLAARTRGVTLITVELNESKVALVRENIARAGVADSVQAVHDDALDYATRFDEIAFCFSDLQPPELNAKVYEKVVPHLVPGGLLVIDNVTSPRLQTELLNRAEKDPRVDSVLLPFPKGDLICRRV
ncbi:MAG TPA: class I SAM-dependent methyltransferase [Candidatus Binatia bacterium]|nr:class I SAM-dependent methyltransferase [Candidatus Binatia bacterium]